MSDSLDRPTSRQSGTNPSDTPPRNMLQLHLSPPPVSLPSLSDQVPLPTPHPHFVEAVESVGRERRLFEASRTSHSSNSPDSTHYRQVEPATRIFGHLDEVMTNCHASPQPRSLQASSDATTSLHSSPDLSAKFMQLSSGSPDVKHATLQRNVRYEPYDRPHSFGGPASPPTLLAGRPSSSAALPSWGSANVPLASSSRSASRQQVQSDDIRFPSRGSLSASPAAQPLDLPSIDEQAIRTLKRAASYSTDKIKKRQVEAFNRAVKPLDEKLLTLMTPARLYPTAHEVKEKDYMISFEERKIISVYEYIINGSRVMIDTGSSYVHFSGIWKAVRSDKLDFSRIFDSHPHLEPFIKRVHEGSQAAQGHWLPFRLAEELSRKMAWSIRHDLIPLFGQNFPVRCLPPQAPEFGIVSLQVPATMPTGIGTARKAATPLRGRPRSAQQQAKKVEEKRKKIQKQSSSLGLTGMVGGMEAYGYENAARTSVQSSTSKDLLESPLTQEERQLMVQWIKERRAREREQASSKDLFHAELQRAARQRYFNHEPPSPGAPAKVRRTVPSSKDVGAKRNDPYLAPTDVSALGPSVLAPLNAARETVQDDWSSTHLNRSKFSDPLAGEWTSERSGSFATRSLFTWNGLKESFGSFSEARVEVDDVGTEDESPFAWTVSTDIDCTATRMEPPLQRELGTLAAPRRRSMTLPTFSVTPATGELEGSFTPSVNHESVPETNVRDARFDSALARFVRVWSAHDQPEQAAALKENSPAPVPLPQPNGQDEQMLRNEGS